MTSLVKPATPEQTENIDSSRRRFMRFGLCAATSLVLPEAMAASRSLTGNTAERRLSLHNLHTGERLDTVYWMDGKYLGDQLASIEKILRDHRTGEKHNIDLKLLDLLSDIHHTLDGKHSFQIISGYRSPKTNASLRQHSNGVAKKSLHMQGKAIDIRLPGRELTELRKAALSYKAGGVGFYPASDFLHIDTGRVRHWG